MLEEFLDEVDDPGIMFDQDADHKRKDRLDKCKQKLKAPIRCFFFFTIGLLLCDYPILVIQGILFLAYIFCTE